VASEPYWVTQGHIPRVTWDALLRLGLNDYQAYRAFQIIEGCINSMKTTTLPDFLTDEQIKKVQKLYPDTKAIRVQVIEPNMAEINRKLGQENNAAYLAYAVVYVLDQVKLGLHQKERK